MPRLLASRAGQGRQVRPGHARSGCSRAVKKWGRSDAWPISCSLQPSYSHATATLQPRSDAWSISCSLQPRYSRRRLSRALPHLHSRATATLQPPVPGTLPHLHHHSNSTETLSKNSPAATAAAQKDYGTMLQPHYKPGGLLRPRHHAIATLQPWRTATALAPCHSRTTTLADCGTAQNREFDGATRGGVPPLRHAPRGWGGAPPQVCIILLMLLTDRKNTRYSRATHATAEQHALQPSNTCNSRATRAAAEQHVLQPSNTRSSRATCATAEQHVLQPSNTRYS